MNAISKVVAVAVMFAASPAFADMGGFGGLPTETPAVPDTGKQVRPRTPEPTEYPPMPTSAQKQIRSPKPLAYPPMPTMEKVSAQQVDAMKAIKAALDSRDNRLPREDVFDGFIYQATAMRGQIGAQKNFTIALFSDGTTDGIGPFRGKHFYAAVSRMKTAEEFTAAIQALRDNMRVDKINHKAKKMMKELGVVELKMQNHGFDGQYYGGTFSTLKESFDMVTKVDGSEYLSFKLTEPVSGPYKGKLMFGIGFDETFSFYTLDIDDLNKMNKEDKDKYYDEIHAKQDDRKKTGSFKEYYGILGEPITKTKASGEFDTPPMPSVKPLKGE